MSLPAKLLYENSIQSSYARNFTSVINAQNTSEYNVGQTCIINIPTMNNQFLSGSDTILNYKLKVRSSVATTYANLVRAGGAGAIQRLRLFHGSTLLCDIDNYATLAGLMTAYQLSSDDVKGKSKVLQGTDEGGHGVDLGVIATGADTELDLSFPLISILSLTDNYVPCWAMTNAPLRLELQFVSNLAQLITSDQALVAAGSGNVFHDVKLIANFVEVSDAGMSIVRSSLGDGPVSWVCSSYSNYVFNTNLPTAEKQVSMPVPAKFNSLKALYFVFREQFAGVATKPCDDAPNFKLKEYSTRIGSKVIPSEKPNSVPQFLAEMERALGSVGNRISPHSYTSAEITAETSVAAGANARAAAFAIGVETESYSSAPMNSVYQGLNTATDDVFFQPTFSAQAGATDIRIDGFAHYDQLCIIDNGQAQVQF